MQNFAIGQGKELQGRAQCVVLPCICQSRPRGARVPLSTIMKAHMCTTSASPRDDRPVEARPQP
jgi:hypothetical protein